MLQLRYHITSCSLSCGRTVHDHTDESACAVMASTARRAAGRRLQHDGPQNDHESLVGGSKRAYRQPFGQRMAMLLCLGMSATLPALTILPSCVDRSIP